MATNRFCLSPGLHRQIIGGIQAGAYPQVAAEAFGVPKHVFDDWMTRGADADAREPYRSFADEVRQSLAQTRLRAEMIIFEADSKSWLIHGPGREIEGNPGWSVSVKPAQTCAAERNALLDPQLMSLFRSVLEVLTPYPDARSQVAQLLLSVNLKPEA